MGDFRLREVTKDDLPVFFEHQKDSAANRMAAFQARDWDAFQTHWIQILANLAVIKKTIDMNGKVAGYIMVFESAGEQEIGFWIGKEFWGNGIATGALTEFLGQVSVRPLSAVVAKHNRGSLRVLEKCGFKIVGEDKKFANIGGEVVEGIILKLAP